MAWFKIDDGFYSSRKVLSIPRNVRLQAIGIWTLAGAWSAKELTDGIVPGYVLEELGCTTRIREALIEASLWLDQAVTKPSPSVDQALTNASSPLEPVAFHDWNVYQPTRAQVEEYRANERERKAKARSVRADKVRNPVGIREVSHAETVLPDPTTTKPQTKTSNEVLVSAKPKSSRIPEDFEITFEMRLWANENIPGLDIDRATESFIDYWASTPGTKALKTDWVATWRNWMRREATNYRPAKQTAVQRGLTVVEQLKQFESKLEVTA